MKTYNQFIEENREKIATYIDQFVAIHPEQGILHASKDLRTLYDHLNTLDEKLNDETIIIHTSMPF